MGSFETQAVSKVRPWLRRRYRALRLWIVRHCASYDAPRLLAALRSIGVERGDTILVHSAWDLHNGFRGSIDSLLATWIESVGAEGNVLMVSLPYRSSTLAYLRRLERFDVRTTPSQMGLVSEMFRRRPDVLRSLHPTHPVLALGPRAEWIVEGHERSSYPCGPGTPFEKLVALDGRVVFYNVPFTTFTFFHHIEHHVRETLPFPLYTDELFEVPVIDAKGAQTIVATRAFSAEAVARRRPRWLERELQRRGQLGRCRVGNSRLIAVRVRDALVCAQEMVARGLPIFDLGGHVAAGHES